MSVLRLGSVSRLGSVLRLASARSFGAAVDGIDGLLFSRLRVWWFGFDPRAVPIEAVTEAVVEEVVDVAEEPVDRLALAQKIWGPGFLVPGGVDYVMTMVKPFGVNPAMSLLDLTAGLGGPSRHVSQFFDVYITAMERAPEIAKRGQIMSVDAGLGKKVPVTAYDPETVELKPHAFDCAYAEYLTVSVVAKERLIREVMRSLKARGQFSFVDFVLAEGELEDPRLEALRRIERFAPMPWRIKEYTDCLSACGFDVRISEDHTDLFLRHVAQGWAQFVQNYDVKAMTRGNQQAVAEEAELWNARVAALQSGVLRVYRLYSVSTYGSVS
ncbi:MAG TPA: methyltransferase domain-containing protein [Aliidongia sp.]|uniref:methyltransferase domain-containing protein n=1 Tax=Aliidongia sp. TaxID=1914230 RepID=UPI002DDD8BFB|nr:methyltransferase domain-containing protein [Aliidongia sp.]HEV2673558.1 methyltransferase domain-containing protein [Aliidongia sp.]